MSRKALVAVNVLSGTSDPTTPTLRAGDLFYNTSTSKLRSYSGSAWADVGTGAAPGNMVTTDSTQTGLTGDKTSNAIWTAGVLSAAGLTGATSASRYVGATTSGAPASGTFVTGDFTIARDGKLWICTSGGSPGTWTSSVPASSFSAKGDLLVGTASGTYAARAVGTNGYALVADSGQSDGVKWAAIPESYVMSVTGAVTVTTGKSRVYLEGNYTVETIRAAVNTAPTGASLIVDVNKNGTTLFTTQGNRPTISASGNLSTVTAPDVTTFASGDYITVDVDQVGSTVAGSDLTVTIRLRKT